MDQAFPSNLTHQQWKFIEPMLPKARTGGRPRSTNLRLVVDAIFYVSRTGCQWRYLPKCFPPWQTVYDYFRKWSHSGDWLKLSHELHIFSRLQAGRAKLPRLGIVDSQTVKAYYGEQIGVNGFKNIKGRKRHIIVDTQGVILGCKVGAANIHDSDGGEAALYQLPDDTHDSVETILGDSQYSARFWARAHVNHGIHVETPPKTRPGKPRELNNLFPKRWIVERTFAWLNNYRRLSKDYERRVLHSESMLYIAMLPILLERLCA